MKPTKQSQIDVSDRERTTDIDAALSHLRIARSHIIPVVRLSQFCRSGRGNTGKIPYDRPYIDQGIAHLSAYEPERDDERGFTITCDNCDEEFDPWDVTRSIVGPHTALHSCSNCRNTIRGPEPYLRDRDDTDDTNTNEDSAQ